MSGIIIKTHSKTRLVAVERDHKSCATMTVNKWSRVELAVYCALWNMPWQVKMCRCLRCCPAVPISELNHYLPSVCCLKCDEAFDMNQIMSSIFLPRTDYFKFWDRGRLVLFLFLFVLITLILEHTIFLKFPNYHFYEISKANFNLNLIKNLYDTILQ